LPVGAPVLAPAVGCLALGMTSGLVSKSRPAHTCRRSAARRRRARGRKSTVSVVQPR